MTSKKITQTLRPFKESHEFTDLCLEVSLYYDGPLWLIEYQVQGLANDQKLLWPPITTDQRQHNLWETTCMEAFFMDEDGHYEEWNFSATGAWNCFSFTKYRSPQNLVEKSIATPVIKSPDVGLLKVTIEKRPSAKLVNLTSVLEVKTNGKKTLHYLAKTHPKAKADFHDKSCFSSLA